MQDKIFRTILILSAIIIPIIGGGIIYSLTDDASSAFEEFGFWNFIFSDDWNYTPGKESYGALPFITGTLLTTFLALLFCIPFSLPVALFVGEYFRGTKIATVLSTVTDLLAGIPSIIYGLWGFYALRPIFMELEISPQGSGILTAAFVLAIMIVPYAASLSAEFIKMVPSELKEGAYAMGATRAEVIKRVIFPMAGSGVFSAYILAIGRALGETRTETFLIDCHRIDSVSYHSHYQHDWQDSNPTCPTRIRCCKYDTRQESTNAHLKEQDAISIGLHFLRTHRYPFAGNFG